MAFDGELNEVSAIRELDDNEIESVDGAIGILGIVLIAAAVVVVVFVAGAVAGYVANRE